MKLPIQQSKDHLLGALKRGPRLVLTAPTGSGKTTGLPPMLLESGLLRGRALILQPRRLAVRLVAERLRGELGAELVGYQSRLEASIDPRNRLRFLTEGLLLRLLLQRPQLPGVDAVIFDEFHERSLEADTGLALLRRLQATSRPDLRLIVMSATLEAEQLAADLNAPSVHVPARAYPVRTGYLRHPETRPCWELAARAIRRLIEDDEPGDVLVFMPGAYEIRKTIAACRGIADRVDLRALHGRLAPHQQDAALAESDRRRVIVATNIAQTSITIPGIRHVVDSGLARVQRYDPARGFNSLKLEPISQAAAEQRAGRAGRTAPGTCHRLWTRAQHAQRPAQDEPEVRRLELSDTLLLLRALGVDRPLELPWLEPPLTAEVRRGATLLSKLGAVEATTRGGGGDQSDRPDEGTSLRLGPMLPRGQRMAQLPMPARLGRFLADLPCQADRTGGAGDVSLADRACLWAAVLSERSPMEQADRKGTLERAGFAAQGLRSDLQADEWLIRQVTRARFDGGRCRALGVSAAACRAVDHTRRLYLKRWRALERSDGSTEEATTEPDDADELARRLIGCYPDRLACRPGGEGPRAYRLADGQKGTLAPGSLAEGAQLILPLEIQRLEAQTMLQTAIALEPEWLIDLAGDEIQEERLTRYDPDQRAVRRVERLKWGNLILDDSERDEPEADLAASALAEAILDGLVELPGWDERVDQWIARVRCVAAWFPERGLPKYERPDLSAALTQALRASQASRAKHLKKLEALSAVKQAMSWEEQRFVEQMAPERYRLPSGHGMKIHYEPGAPPLGKAKIQDFYDQRHTPRVGGGRQAVLLEILGPNFRPVQRTDDLPGFWQRLYPELKKELKRRYPRHQWR